MRVKIEQGGKATVGAPVRMEALVTGGRNQLHYEWKFDDGDAYELVKVAVPDPRDPEGHKSIMLAPDREDPGTLHQNVEHVFAKAGSHVVTVAVREIALEDEYEPQTVTAKATIGVA